MNLKYSFLTLLSVLLIPAVALKADLSPENEIIGVAEKTDGWIKSADDKPLKITGRLSSPIEESLLIIKGRTGKDHGIGLSFDNGAKVSIRASNAEGSEDVTLGTSLMANGKSAGGGRVWTRPNPRYYKAHEIAARQAEWDSLPRASESEFTLEVRSGETEMEVWLNGQFTGYLPVGNTGESGNGYEITLQSPEAAIRSVAQERQSTTGLPVPIALNPRANGEATVRAEKPQGPKAATTRVPVEGMPDARLEFSPEAKLPTTFQSLAGKDASGIAIGGLGKIPGIVSMDLQSLFWGRSGMVNLSEQRMFTVPMAAYGWANVLCAVDDHPGRVNRFTLRVTRYGEKRGDAMADTLVEVPRSSAAPSPHATPVGAVTYGPADARKAATLWLMRVPIRNGQIEDLLYQDTSLHRYLSTHRFLDVELLDPLAHSEEQDAFPPQLSVPKREWRPVYEDPGSHGFYRTHPEPSPVSGVTVFGVELVKAPATMRVESRPGTKVFYASEKPEFLAKVAAREAGEYTVRWQVADVDGKEIANGAKPLNLEAGADGTVSVPLNQGNGWYAIRLILTGPDQEALLVRNTSFVMLPENTRKAKREDSPFYGWWFGDFEVGELGALLQRLGVHRADRVGAGENFSEAESLPHGFTSSHVTWGYPEVSGRAAFGNFLEDKMSLSEAVSMHEESIRRQLERWPSLKRMMVFHESGSRGAPFPRELWGEPAQARQPVRSEGPSPESLLAEAGETRTPEEKASTEYWKTWPKRMEYITAMAKMVREKFPQLKMQYGNNGDSLEMVGEIFRQKFPAEWIDFVAVEDLGQTFVPERCLVGGLHSAWYLRELTRKMGYEKVPVTACTEWIGRMSLRLGDRKQAEWKARDGLLALAYGFDTISIAGMDDHGHGYYFSPWGNGGLCSRYPELDPKPAFAVVATLTRVLDSSRFRRFRETGSTVFYAAEFQRGDEWIYAFWTPRGDRDATLEFPSAASRTLIDLYGREKSMDEASIKLKAGTAVQYLVSKEPLSSVAAGQAAFPEDRVPERSETVLALESLSDITMVSNPRREEESRKRPGNIPHLREGTFEIREVEDPEMGKCLEVELLPEGELSWAMDHEYVCLNLPAPVKTNAKNAGIWIKGNGSWGNVVLEKTRPTGPWASTGNRHFVWPGTSTLNFDGWNFISYPYYDWTRDEEYSVTGITLTIPRNALVGTEMAPVKNLKIRIKSIVLF